MPTLPTGAITFLFTDIAGSTRLWQAYPQTMPLVLARHDALMRTAIVQNNGSVVKTIGDAFMAVFPTAHDGLNAALTAQRSLCAEPWPSETPIRVRMGLHTGASEERDNDYYGHEVNRAARIQGVVHPEQIVLSQSVTALVAGRLPESVTLLDLGLHQLKDLRDPEPLWQLCHPDLPSTFPPLNSLTHWPNNLPRQISSFVGREAEMAEVRSLLSRCSCLTLAGTGGTGKTRLALQSAADVLPDYPHGVWLIELAALTEPSLVAQAVARALGLREEPGKPLIQTLEEYCHSRTLLLVLDNCEHLLHACALLAGTLLRACPQIKVLATSRETLNIAGEQTYGVPSLSLPDPGQPQTSQTWNRYEASRLFVERASAVKPGFGVTDRNAAALLSICRRLDGIPLAIELAAARVRALPPEEINARLDHRFRLLTGGSRTALPRHQTLRALIDWSYDLLNDREKTLLHRLSVFAGGWALEAAEKVGSGGEIEAFETLDLLLSLTDKSLVVYEEQEGQARYRLLETMRQYAWERLEESGEAEAMQERHRDYFLTLAVEADPKLRSAEQAEWLRKLDTEHENLRGGLEWSLQEPGSAPALRFCGALQQFWWTRGYLAEGQKWCERALAPGGSVERNAERAKAINAAALFAFAQSDNASARACYEESLEIYREVEDRRGIATTLNNLANVACALGDNASARACYEESLGLYRELGDRRGIATALTNLGLRASDRGDYASALAYYDESLLIWQEIGDLHSLTRTLNNLGSVAYYQGDYASARAYHEESLTIRRKLGDRAGIAISLDNLGRAAYETGEYASALTYYEESLAIRQEIGERWGIATTLNNLGMLASRQGDDVSARPYHAESLAIRREIGDRAGIAASLETFALLAVKSGRSKQAATLWGAASALREEIGTPLPPGEREACDREAARVRQVLGEKAFSAARATGAAMTLEQAMDFALRSPASERPL